MIFFLLLGFMFVCLISLFRKQIAFHIDCNNKILLKLHQLEWFRSPFKSGLLLFLINGTLFSLTVLFLFIGIYFLVPVIHLFIMFSAIICSVYCWIAINKTWIGSKIDRLKMAVTGSSFYGFLACGLIYRLITLPPSTPELDMFMAAMGVMFGITVAVVAFFTCILLTGFEVRQEN
ncbi:hypothetical protein DFP93_1361 [Aneurinibacillus soli]|uniref:Uncharacterized protein n=1 Tax=Aneurinibacillus soli TaxID=1500254 RepID=A0A0U5AZS5_9BACL|nr:hypothetical protein [Aneurinibacillus soli]PYE57051.1 hypothetical protein DFP93_1361 [Aneurinibacillus soli]BAU28535.1 hypothetical protein CB4_02709 [Aneurinibacillus soli]BAU29233.1 hypothetical protein CB4_03420 [Aneurinibacillus soli]